MLWLLVNVACVVETLTAATADPGCCDRMIIGWPVPEMACLAVAFHRELDEMFMS